MSRAHLLLGITTVTGLAAALVTPAHASAPAVPDNRPQAAPAAPASSDHAARVQKRLRLSLGARFAGAWVDGGSQVVVATTDASAVSAIKAAGARPKVVKYTERTLDGVQAKLNRHSRSAGQSVHAWYVDTKANTVVVKASSVAAGKRFVAASGVDAKAVKIVRSTAKPRPVYDLVGGERYWTTQFWCSIGFSITNGYLTAGHCGTPGEPVTGADQVTPQGTFAVADFPGNDYAWVDTNDQWTPTPKVTRWNGTYETVRGAIESPVGSVACRSGSTSNTQLWCGNILERNATVVYPGLGAVTGLIRTNICASGGDSGGALISQTGGQAQGTTSGGYGTCADGQGPGDEMYFQPVAEPLQILAQQGRQLVTEGGGPGGPCDGYQSETSGSLTSGSETYQPNGNYTTTTSGAHNACLDGPDGVDFDLYLQRLDGNIWTTVASSANPDPDESISYNGAPGTYRYRIHSYTGSGAYNLGFNKP